MRYPITAALTVRGCRTTASPAAVDAGYSKPAQPGTPGIPQTEDLANDIRRIGSFSSGPVMVLGDIRQAGDDYANRFLEAIAGYKKPIFFELFDAAPKDFSKKLPKQSPIL